MATQKQNPAYRMTSSPLSKRLFALLAAALTAIAVGACDIEPVHIDPRKIDADLVQRLASTKKKAEALSWLQIPDGKLRDFGKDPDYSGQDAVKFVNDLYARGAVSVYAVDIASDANIEETRTLILKLPSDPDKRRKLFEIEAEVSRGGGFDPMPDDGQHYMLLWWG